MVTLKWRVTGCDEIENVCAPIERMGWAYSMNLKFVKMSAVAHSQLAMLTLQTKYICDIGHQRVRIFYAKTILLSQHKHAQEHCW